MAGDPNNRPGGPNLVVTCKSANTIQFFDAPTLALTATLAMPGSTHELIQGPDGNTVYGSIYGGGIFGKNKDPDRRIAVLDLAAKSLTRTIDAGGTYAPHSVMMDKDGVLWVSAELGGAVLAIVPDTAKVTRIDIRGAAHWIAVSHSADKIFASFKTSNTVVAIDRVSRAVAGTLAIPQGAEGIAVTPDGETLFVCAHRKGVFHEFDTRTHALRATHEIAGAPGEANQLRRVRVSPDGRYVCVSSHVDSFAAVYEAATMKQVAGFATPKAPMGFGYAADGKHAYLCCHDAAQLVEFDLASGGITRQATTDAGCEFVIAY
jgi:DNA-binding beta-propeller fold protein YncE